MGRRISGETARTKGPRNDYAMNWRCLTIKDGKAAFHRIALAA
jgi:hypothetical protein